MRKIAIGAQQLDSMRVIHYRRFKANFVSALHAFGKNLEQNPGKVRQAMLVVMNPEHLGLGNSVPRLETCPEHGRSSGSAKRGHTGPHCVCESVTYDAVQPKRTAGIVPQNIDLLRAS